MTNDHLLPEPFDYNTLDEQTRELVLRKADETRVLMRRTTEHIIAIGENLLTIQKQLPEMKFSAWLRTEFAISRQSAYNFMKVASKLGGRCKTVLQLPASVLYEFASSSQAIVEQVEAGQLPPTLDAIRAARESERQARAEARARQATIEQLIRDLEGLRQHLCEMPIPQVEIREVEKRVVPPETITQLDILKQSVVTLIEQRDTLSKQLSELHEEVRAGASERLEGEQERCCLIMDSTPTGEQSNCTLLSMPGRSRSFRLSSMQRERRNVRLRTLR